MPSPTSKAKDVAAAAIADKLRERMTARVAEIKEALSAVLEPHETPADSDHITHALLELALDRHIARHEAAGFDLIEAAYRRALDRWRGPLQ